MKEMNQEELMQIQGGGINWGIIAGISGFASFIIGVIDGLTNPKSCNK